MWNTSSGFGGFGYGKPTVLSESPSEAATKSVFAEYWLADDGARILAASQPDEEV
jgi:hypothetical protein